MLLTKTKLNSIKVLISKALIDLNINHDEFVLVNNMLREYNEMKEEIKNPEISVDYTISIWLIDAEKHRTKCYRHNSK